MRTAFELGVPPIPAWQVASRSWGRVGPKY